MKSHINILQSRLCRNYQKKEYSNFLHTYCDADHARDLSDRLSVTSTGHLFNGTIIGWCNKKQSETSGVLDQNWLRKFLRLIGYPIGPR